MSADVPVSRRTLSSVHNAARLLKSFSGVIREQGVTELAGKLGLGKSTVHRLLATLESEQLVDQNPDTGKYRLGLAILELAGAASSPSELHNAVLIPMSLLRVRTGETVQASVLDGRQVVYVERLESPNTLRLFLEVGRRNYAHSTGSGKCLLAYLSDDELEVVLSGWTMPRLTDYTITDPRDLRQQLKEVRARGYACNRHESEVGVLSVAAPIRDSTRRVIAALSVAGPSQRLDENFDRLVHDVVEAAAMASRRLGV